MLGNPLHAPAEPTIEARHPGLIVKQFHGGPVGAESEFIGNIFAISPRLASPDNGVPPQYTRSSDV